MIKVEHLIRHDQDYPFNPEEDGYKFFGHTGPLDTWKNPSLINELKGMAVKKGMAEDTLNYCLVKFDDGTQEGIFVWGREAT